MPRKKKEKMYFTMDTERAIIEYNKTEDTKSRNKIYEESIKYPFEKLAENILNTFKFSYFDVSKEDVQMEVVSTLIEKIHMFKEGKGKAFSYFSIVAKNHLILKNEQGNEFMEFKELMLKYWDQNLTRVFTKKRDIQIADAVLELFRRSRYIENFNKKHLYLLIREMTDCKTHYITKVVNEMKKHQVKMLNDYLDYGMIKSPSNDFWEEEYL